MISRLLNTIFALLIFHFLTGISLAQQAKPLTFEETAVQYFCDQILKNDLLANVKVRFNGSTNGKKSKVYDVADCFGDINLLKDSIPNNSFLDSLDKFNFNYPKKNLKIKLKCREFKNHCILNKNAFRLNVYNAIEYKGNYCVEFFLVNRRLNTFTIVVNLDKNMEPLSYCIKPLTY